jgi:rhamnosyltransferase
MLPNVASAVSRAVFEAHGGFPEPVVFNEDVQFANAILAKGGRIAYVAEAVVEHGHTYTLMGLLRRYFDNGTSLAEAPEPLRSAATGGAGAGFAMRQARAVVAAGRVDLLPRWVLETGVKWTTGGCRGRGAPASACSRRSHGGERSGRAPSA